MWSKTFHRSIVRSWVGEIVFDCCSVWPRGLKLIVRLPLEPLPACCTSMIRPLVLRCRCRCHISFLLVSASSLAISVVHIRDFRLPTSPVGLSLSKVPVVPQDSSYRLLLRVSYLLTNHPDRRKSRQYIHACRASVTDLRTTLIPPFSEGPVAVMMESAFPGS